LGFDNVTLWFARNANNDIVTINEINDDNKHGSYSCPMCGSALTPKALKSEQVTSHFAHVDASKCNGESMIHWWFKNKFIVPGDSFAIVSDRDHRYVCKEILVEQTYKVGDREYKPDVTVLTECGKTIYFEMEYSNQKKLKDYIDLWLGLRNIVVEVNLKKLMNQDTVPTFTALFYDGKCFNTKKNDLYYNTIGKYKEEKFKHNVANELKERMKKLDWFWDDVCRYNSNEIDIKEIVCLIDSFKDDDMKVVKSILKKSICTKLYMDYMQYKKFGDLHLYCSDMSDDHFIKQAVRILNDRYKSIDDRYYIKLLKKYFVRENDLKQLYTYHILLSYAHKRIETINITNEFLKSHSTIGDVSNTISNIYSDCLCKSAKCQI